jgi:hypothetical protein
MLIAKRIRWSDSNSKESDFHNQSSILVDIEMEIDFQTTPNLNHNHHVPLTNILTICERMEIFLKLDMIHQAPYV